MIVIQGAGISGLTLAGLLEILGFDYLVVESAPELQPIGAGIVLQRNALAVLNLFRRGDPYSHCVDIKAMVLGTPEQPNLQSVALDASTRAAGFHRGALQQFLIAQVPTHRLLLNRTVTRWTPSSSQLMNVELSNGETVTASLLVGADGIASSIRRQLEGPPRMRNSGQWCARTIIESHLFERRAMEIHGGRLRLGVVPLAQQQSYVFWVRSRHDGSVMNPASIARSLDDMGDIGRRISKQLGPTQQWLQHPLLDLPISWGKERVVLIGDAAHAVTPNMGQGAALGIEDAYVLAAMLASDCQSVTAQALKQRRHSRIRTIRTLSYLMGRIAHIESPRLQRVRAELLKRSGPEHSRQAVAAWLDRFTGTMAQFEGTPLGQSPV